jgi:alanine racemase
MSRLGIQANEALQLARIIQDTEGITLEGIFTHYARADETDQRYSDLQEQRFQNVVNQIIAAGLKPPLVHAANSAAALIRPGSRFNLVRTGIALYGLNPSKECKLPPDFRASLTWKSILTQVKVVPPGVGVSYGSEYVTRSDERIGTVPVGYADGYRRVKGNRIVVRGVCVPVIGRVCMDQVSVQLDSVPEAMAGDEVILIGRQRDAQVTAGDLADYWGTVNYEVVCGIGSRVPRLYLES